MLATKGAGLLGKTDWTDDEDEDEIETAEQTPKVCWHKNEYIWEMFKNFR